MSHQQYGEGVAEAIAKKREEAALVAISSTNRLCRYGPYLCMYASIVFCLWCAGWALVSHDCSGECSTPFLTAIEEESFRSFSFACTGAFGVSFIFVLMQVVDSSVKGSVRTAPVYCTAVINLVSFCTHLALSQGIFPSLASPLGRHSHAVRWGEWLAVAPVLMIMMQSLDIRSDEDFSFMIVSALVQVVSVLSGLGVYTCTSPRLATALLCIHHLAGAQILYVTYRAMHRFKSILSLDAELSKRNDSPLHEMISTRLQPRDENSRSAPNDTLERLMLGNAEYSVSNNDDIIGAVKNLGIVIAFTLSVYCSITWLVSITVSLLSMRGLVTHYEEAVLVSLVDILDKCLYLRVLCSGHGTAVSPEGLLTRMLVLEEKANASIRLFMRFIFHEVSSPLDAINFGLDVLKSEPLDEDGQETLQTILVSSMEIQDALETFRAQKSVTANLYAKIQPVNFKTLVRDIAWKQIDIADQSNVSLLLALDQRIPELCMMNESGMRVVITSFIANGIAIASTSGSTCTVISELKSKVGPKVDKISVYFSVKDDGKGLSNEDCEAVFTPFSRLRAGNVRSRLNLSAAKQILDVHGGKAGYDNSADKGSNFYFTIDFYLLKSTAMVRSQSNFLSADIVNYSEPLALSAETDDSHRLSDWRRTMQVDSPPRSLTQIELTAEGAETSGAAASLTRLHVVSERVEVMADSEKKSEDHSKQTEAMESSADSEDSLKSTHVTGMTALLVDDVRSNRRMYMRILELLSFTVVLAEDGLQALAAVKSAARPFDVIFMDHSMVRPLLYYL